jgi:hypothetical protein
MKETSAQGKNIARKGNRTFTQNQLQPAGVPGIFPSALSEMYIREISVRKDYRPQCDKKKLHTRCSRPYPLIYNKSFVDDSGTCVFRRLLACLKLSFSLSQLSFKFFQCLDRDKTKFPQGLKKPFLVFIFRFQMQAEDLIEIISIYLQG